MDANIIDIFIIIIKHLARSLMCIQGLRGPVCCLAANYFWRCNSWEWRPQQM